MSINYERSLTPSESLKIACQAINDFNLKVEENCYGDEFKTYHCKLIDSENKNIFFGCGKGLGLQSKVSAYYEALEHYSVYRFAQLTANNQDNYVDMHPYEHTLPCVDLTNIQNNEKLSYPIFMLDPRYAKHKSKYDNMNYSPYSYLTNDSGIASGSNILEASIHSLNELVERDAHSLFLIEAFIKNNNQMIKVIDKTTLPATLQDIVYKIEQRYHDDLMIFDITSEIGIPVIYVSMTKQSSLIQPFGCGASLRAEYALERALLESLQPLHIYNENMIDNQQKIINALSNYPILLKTAIADVTTLNNKYQIINFNSKLDQNEHLTLEEQLNLIIKKIEITGCKVFKKLLMNLDSGFTCVKFLIPDFEQFFLVQTGKHILPNKRGMGLLMTMKP